ncbi:MAG: tetratricopeptide repeat protein [Phycisphaerae bacterium]|nr:tetratricopeptide repeat protein [Phycisphaerae bacterium]
MARLILATSILAGVASVQADTVFLRNGNTRKGTVVETTDAHVRFRPTGADEVVTIPADDVLFVRRSGDGDDGESAEPVDETPAGDAVPADGTALEGLSKRFDPETVALPQSYVFHLLRRLDETPAGAPRRRLAEQIEQWRIYVHDQRRHVDGRWLTREQLAERREAFERTRDEAEALIASFRHRRRDTWRRDKIRKDYDKWQAALAKFQEAVKYWPDRRIGAFLKARVHLEAEQYKTAAVHFDSCRQDCPFVAGFAQGYGRALLKLERYEDALSAYVRVLRLWPGSVEAIYLLHDGLKQTPGGLMETPAFKQAKALLNEYVEPRQRRRHSRRQTTWLMPGDGSWTTTRQQLLPTPPADRLIVRQGIAVPVTENVLMVDASVVGEQKRVQIRLAPGHIVSGYVRRRSVGFGARAAAPVVAFVTLDGYTFRPLPRELSEPPEARSPVTLYGLSLHAEMGRSVRVIDTTVREADEDGGLTLGKSLLPGEAAGVVLTPSGTLVGMMAGRTDPMAPGGGPIQAIDGGHLTEVLENVERGSRAYVRYGRVDRKGDAPDRPVAGRAFVVYAVEPERIGK